MAKDPYRRLRFSVVDTSIEVSQRRIDRARERLARCVARLADSSAASEASMASLSRRTARPLASAARVRDVLQAASDLHGQARDSIRLANELALETREIIGRIRASRAASKGR